MTKAFAGYERYAAMRLAERYHRLPEVLRESVLAKAVGLLPTSEVRAEVASEMPSVFLKLHLYRKLNVTFGGPVCLIRNQTEDLFAEFSAPNIRGSRPKFYSNHGLPALMGQELSTLLC